MADFTSFIKGKGKLDVFNNLYLTLAILVSAGLALYGYQAGNLGLFAAGMVFIPLLLLGDFASSGRLRYSPASFGAAAWAFWIGRGFSLVPKWFGNIQFSFFSTPGQGYLSSALAQTSPAVQTIVNIFLAPIVENSAIIGVGGLLYRLARRAGFGKIGSLIIALTPTSIAFGALHGLVSTSFFFMAAAVMAFMIGTLVGTDAGIFNLPLVPVTFGFTVGIHSGINIASTGGLLAYYGSIMSASTPVLFASIAIMAFEVLTILALVTSFDWFLDFVASRV